MTSSDSIPDWPSLAKLNPEFEALLPSLNGFSLFGPTTTIQDLRGMGKGKLVSPKWPDVAEEDVMVAMPDGFENRVRIYSPVEGKGGKEDGRGPLLVMVHGGGFCLGKLEQEDRNCRSFVRRFGGVAVGVEHRLAPEAAFPVPVMDVYEAVKWAARNTEMLNADPSKGFILGGVSSGANAILVAAHLYRDDQLSPPITGLYAAIPGVCNDAAIPSKYRARVTSRQQNKDAPIFNQAASELFAKSYPADIFSPLRSPLLFPSHANLPPTYLIVAGCDLSRDHALLYDELLRESGVKTKVDIFPGLPHGFWNFFPEAGFSKDLVAKSDQGFAWLVGGSS